VTQRAPTSLLTTCLALCLAVFSSATIGAQAAGLRARIGSSFSAKVTSVVDGDTVHVVDGSGRRIVVRLEGIDTPERGEPFSAQARTAARVLLFDKTATLRATDVDRFGRLVARVYVDGSDTSVAQVRAGLACHYTRFSKDPLLARAVEQAKGAGAGFWAAGAAKPGCATGNRPKSGGIRER
jgi:endonuclease YncB( thermonuclease family)